MKFSILLTLCFCVFSADLPNKTKTSNSDEENELEKDFLSSNYYAKAYYNPRPWEVGGTARSSLHEFDCSTPRWRKQYPISYCAISSNIDLVLYELENYQGEYRVLSRSTDLKGYPKKFKSPGSIEVLYKGDRKCISAIGRASTNNSNRPSLPSQQPSSSRVEKPAVSYISSGTNTSPLYTYIENSHPTRAIEVKYKSYYGASLGWSQTIKIIVEAQSKKPVFLNKKSPTEIITAIFFD